MSEPKEFFERQAKAKRPYAILESGQMTLGEMIKMLEPIADDQEYVIKKYKEEATVRFDFEYMNPTTMDSWRGVYSQLALGFKEIEMGKEPKVSEFLKMLKETVGKTFEGYKGGDSVMKLETPVWVANYGNTGYTAIVDILDGEHTIYLITAHIDF